MSNNTLSCDYDAPLFAIPRGGKRFSIIQGCCNHWDCNRCGIQVAKQHYGRIVAGAREIVAHGHKLAFLTVTCRGKELDAEDAFLHYLSWTNRLIDAMRAKALRATKTHEPEFWAYAQVTEKQKRSHPHSHFLTCFMPDDTYLGLQTKWKQEHGDLHYVEIEALRSDWLQGEVVRCGLGEQYDISEVAEVEAASRYVAKYMFKKTMFQSKFPKGWKRVRYSQSWPKLPERVTNAYVLMSIEDWARLGSEAAVVDATPGVALAQARRYLTVQDVIVYETMERVKGEKTYA